MSRRPTAANLISRHCRKRLALVISAAAVSMLGGCAATGETANLIGEAIEGEAAAQESPLPDHLVMALVAAPVAASLDDLEDIKWLTAILANPANDAATRVGAAVRLLNMGLPEAYKPLKEAILSGDAGLMLAVIDALGEASESPPALLDPLIQSLRNPPSSVLGPLALAIARYGDPALVKVRELARDHELTDDERRGPIHTLGSFRNQAAAIELMAMLDEEDGEAIVNAVCAALRRGTGLPYGNDPAEWKRWWRDAVNQPPEQWLTNLVQRLAEQLAAEQQQTQREREKAAALERRYGEFLRDYFPHIRDEEEQMRRLRALMDDRLASVRLFAVDRIARLLRDSIRIADDVQSRLVELLDDEDAEIRRRTARLVDQLNIESAGERIAQRLTIETSPDVASVLMDILIKRPTPAALEPVRVWLADQASGMSNRAAAVAWEVSGALALDETQTTALREAVRSADRWRDSPEHARLLGAVGGDDDLHRIEPLLDHDDPAMRQAVAEAYLRRILRQPLLDRAADEVIYPFAIRSLSRDPVDMSSVRRALALRPWTETGRSVWNDTLLKIAAKLPAPLIIELDDHLAALPSGDASPQLRADVLARGRAIPVDAVDPAVRAEILTRLAQQLLLLDQPLAAYEAMETVNGESLGDLSRRVKFEAAVLSRRYEVALALKPTPEPWMHLLARLAERTAPGAADLRDEIDRRFAERLNGELKAEFDRLSERIARQRAEAASEPSA